MEHTKLPLPEIISAPFHNLCLIDCKPVETGGLSRPIFIAPSQPELSYQLLSIEYLPGPIINIARKSTPSSIA